MSAHAAAPLSPAPSVLADLIPRDRVRDAALVVGGAGLTALGAQLTMFIPPSPVPFTAQTLGVILAGATLGMRRGAASQLLYVLLGLMLPIYADGGHGLDHLLGASGGYLIGMVLAAAAIGHVCEGGADRRPTRAFAAFVVGQLLIFGVGVPWLKAYTGMSWGDAIHDGFTIFIAGGIVKALIGAAALPLAWRLVSGLQGGHRR